MSTEVLPLETEETVLPPAPPRVPKKWSDLSKTQVIQAADYFGTRNEGTVREMLADLEDAAVTWDMYVSAILNEQVPEEVPLGNQIPEEEIEWIDGEVTDNMTEEVLVTAPLVPVMAPSEKYLIKFIGQNPYFERGKYKFTAERPYAIMPAEDAQDALVDEPKKFRQAFPDELKEFYS